MYMEWNETFKVGIGSIDAQHIKLFSLMNEISDAIDEKRSNEAIGKTLEAVLEYSKTHLAHEENIMRENDYPDYAEHKKAHDQLIKTATEMYDRFKHGEPLMAFDLFLFLVDWWKKHIQGTDKLYSKHLNSKGVR